MSLTSCIAKVITGTSAGALVAAFVCTHTDDELRRMIIAGVAEKITACEDPFPVWFKRLWLWTNGSITFREAYERTGRGVQAEIIE